MTSRNPPAQRLPRPLTLAKMLRSDPERPKAAHLTGGLRYGLKIADLLVAQLPVPEHGSGITISGHGGQSDGVFFQDDVHRQAARISMHSSSGCILLYLGSAEDFEFETKLPKEASDLDMICFDESDLHECVELMVKHFKISSDRKRRASK